MKKKTKSTPKRRRAPKRKPAPEQKKSRLNILFSEEMKNYGDLEDLSEEELTYHDQFDDDYDENDDEKAGREGAHTTATGSTNNSRFGGKQQYAAKTRSKKTQGGDGQTGYFWKRPRTKKQ